MHAKEYIPYFKPAGCLIYYNQFQLRKIISYKKFCTEMTMAVVNMNNTAKIFALVYNNTRHTGRKRE